jgi:hypothetical protein
MQQIQCAGCGRPTPGYDIVQYGSIERGYRQLCNSCFNAEVAQRADLSDFENIQFEPVVMNDASGNVHEFHFRTRLRAAHVSLEAFELLDDYPGGYRFQVLGDPEGDLMVLLGKLIEKMRRALSLKHIEDGKLGRQIADHQTVRGLVDWDDESDGRVRLLIIDGRRITWEEFGHMLMSFEGWQFKLEVRDFSEEV